LNENDNTPSENTSSGHLPVMDDHNNRIYPELEVVTSTNRDYVESENAIVAQDIIKY